jgi:hypothetical protein
MDEPVAGAYITMRSSIHSWAHKRPVVPFNRGQKDWSVLANPCVPRELLDGVKSIPLDGRRPACPPAILLSDDFWRIVCPKFEFN